MSRTAVGERGTALLVLPVAIAAVMVLLAGAARMSTAVVERSRADAVADVVALAAVSDSAGVNALSQHNGAELVEHLQSGSTHVVTVRLGGATAVAAAEGAG